MVEGYSAKMCQNLIGLLSVSSLKSQVLWWSFELIPTTAVYVWSVWICERCSTSTSHYLTAPIKWLPCLSLSFPFIYVHLVSLVSPGEVPWCICLDRQVRFQRLWFCKIKNKFDVSTFQTAAAASKARQHKVQQCNACKVLFPSSLGFANFGKRP